MSMDVWKLDGKQISSATAADSKLALAMPAGYPYTFGKQASEMTERAASGSPLPFHGVPFQMATSKDQR